jgi:hypothetical protein
MSASKKRKIKHGAAQAVPELKTEGPLKDRDLLDRAAERTQKLGLEALEQWRRLRQRINDKFKR